jgi:hypothetical protein
VCECQCNSLALDTGLFFESPGNFVDHRHPHPEVIDGKQDRRLLLVRADCERLGPNSLRDALGLRAAAAEAVQTNGIAGRDVDFRNADRVLAFGRRSRRNK